MGTFLAQPHCFPVAEWECMTISSIGEVGPQYDPSRYIAKEEEYLQHGHSPFSHFSCPWATSFRVQSTAIDCASLCCKSSELMHTASTPLVHQLYQRYHAPIFRVSRPSVWAPDRRFIRSGSTDSVVVHLGPGGPRSLLEADKSIVW